MELLHSNEKSNQFDKLSATKIKLLEFILYINKNKLQKFMKLEPDLCSVPLKDENGKILDFTNLKKKVKELIKKNIFIKSLLRDAWVKTRLRIAYIYMERVDLDRYQECIKEVEKEINNRMQTHQDEEAHVLNVILKMEILKRHIKNHDLDSLIQEYDKMKQHIKYIKTTDFGFVLNFRINAGIGYAAKLTSNEIVLHQRFQSAVSIFKFHNEDKKQIAFVDEDDRFIYFYSQLQLCKYMQRIDQTDLALEQAENIIKKMQNKKLLVKAKDHLLRDYQQFLRECVSYIQNDQSQRTFENKNLPKKSIRIKSLLDFNQLNDNKRNGDRNENLDDDQVNQITKYQSNYKAQGILSKYLNHLQKKSDENKQGVLVFTKYNNNKQKSKNQLGSKQEILDQNIEKNSENNDIQNKDESNIQNLQQNDQQDQADSQNQDLSSQQKQISKDGKQIKFKPYLFQNLFSKNVKERKTSAVEDTLINLLTGKDENSNIDSQEQFSERKFPRHQRVFTEGDLYENCKNKNIQKIFEYGQDSKIQSDLQLTQPNSERMSKIKFFKKSKEAIQIFSMPINEYFNKNAKYDGLITETVLNTQSSINKLQNGMIIQDFLDKNPSIYYQSQYDQEMVTQQIYSGQESPSSFRPDQIQNQFKQSNYLPSQQQNQIQQDSYQDLRASEKLSPSTRSERMSPELRPYDRLNSDLFTSDRFISQMGISDRQGNQMKIYDRFSTEMSDIPQYQDNQQDNQTLQTKFSVTIEKEGIGESQLDQLKNTYFKETSQKVLFTQTNQNDKLKQLYLSNQKKSSDSILYTQESTNTKTMNPYGLQPQVIQITEQSQQQKGGHRKSKTLQQCDNITDLLQQYSHKSRHSKNQSQDNQPIKIEQQQEIKLLQNNIQSKPKFQLQIIPSEIEQFHIPPSFQQKGSNKISKKFIPTNLTSSPSKSITTPTQFSSQYNLYQTKDSIISNNSKPIENLTAEQSAIMHPNNNNFTQEINNLSKNGNKIRQISLLTNKTQTNSITNQQDIVQEQQLQTENINSQASFEGVFSHAFNNQNNIAKIKSQHLKSNSDFAYQKNKNNYFGLYIEDTANTQHTLSSQRQSLTSYPATTRNRLLTSASSKQGSISKNKQICHTARQSDDKKSYLQIYLNQMLAIDNSSSNKQQFTSKSMMQFMKDNFQKNKLKQSDITQQIQMQNEISQNQQLNSLNISNRQHSSKRPSSSNIQNLNQYMMNQQIDYLFNNSPQQMNLAQDATNKLNQLNGYRKSILSINRKSNENLYNELNKSSQNSISYLQDEMNGQKSLFFKPQKNSISKMKQTKQQNNQHSKDIPQTIVKSQSDSQTYQKEESTHQKSGFYNQSHKISGLSKLQAHFQSDKFKMPKNKTYRNSFDSDNSFDEIQNQADTFTPSRNLLRRVKNIESIDIQDEQEDDDYQLQKDQRHQRTPNNFSQLKSINSIAMMILGRKNWFHVQNREMLISERINKSKQIRDNLSQLIADLSLKSPVFSFCTHRIGRFQHWKVRYVNYIQDRIDNLFYKMYIPVKQFKEFGHEKNKFITIWPIILEYLQDYMTSKKIVLKFKDDLKEEKKYVFQDVGISEYYAQNKILNDITKLTNRVINYKRSGTNKICSQDIDNNNNSRDSNSDSSYINSDELDTDGRNRRNRKNLYKFFLGLASKNSYFPTIRDAKAAAKIKKIFEVLLYRYMYDQVRSTGKKLILKKDASIQKYKTLSKRIQKLENDLGNSAFKQQNNKAREGNTVDNLLSKKFGTVQLRKLVQKDLMKIPDKQEYQIEQVWRLRYRENAYQLCSFIVKTKEHHYYQVSFCIAFKKDHNALLQILLKKNDANKSLKDQFDKIIQVQLLRKPKIEKNLEEQIKEKQQREQKILSMIEQQQMTESISHQSRTSHKRNSFVKLSTYGSRTQSSQTIPAPVPVVANQEKKQIKNEKIFKEDDFKEILSHFDLNQIIRGIVYHQKIPKNFKNLCIKNLKRRLIITEEQLFLRLDKIDIIRRKINQPPPILVQTEIPELTDPRMKDFLTKQNPFNQKFEVAYQKSEFRQEEKHMKQQNNDESDLSDDNDTYFNGIYGNHFQIKEVQEEFERIEKAEKANNYYFEELHFKCSCNMKQSSDVVYLKFTFNSTFFYLKVTMHGSDHSHQDHLLENIHAHLDITVISPFLRFRKTYSTNKRKALLLFNSYKKLKFKNAFEPPIYLKTRKRIELDFQTNIQRVSKRKTIGEIMQRTEVRINNLSELPAFELLKIALLKNQSSMESLRSYKRYSVVDSISSFGKHQNNSQNQFLKQVVVTMTIFYDHGNGKFYTLEFQDFTSKSRLYRIALNDNDLADLFGMRLFPEDSGVTIIKIIRRICYHVRFEQQNFYRVPFLYFREEQYRKGLQLNARNINEKHRKNEFYGNYRRFYNKIVKNTFEKEFLKQNKKLYLIDAQRKHSRIIFHKAVVHQNEYFIMTIQKSLNLQEFWMIYIYVPKTGRRIMGYIQSKDIEQIQFQNLTKDMGLFSLYDKDKPFKSYADFLSAVITNIQKESARKNKNMFMRTQIKQLSQKFKGQNSIKLQQSKAGDIEDSPLSNDFALQDEINDDHLVLPSEDEPVKFIFSPRQTPRIQSPQVAIPKRVIQRHEKRYGTHIQFNSSNSNQIQQTDAEMKTILVEKFTQITNSISKAYKQSYVLSYRLSNLSQFVEMKIWEDITNKMILNHKGSAYVMQMGNISVPMQEYINSSQIQTDQGPEIFVEYFIGKQNNSGEYLVTQNFEEISYPASLNYYIYLRLYYFNQVGIMHKKVNLRELLNLFIADGYYKYQTNYMHSKLQLQDLVQLCDFVSYKLRTGTYGSILNQNQFQFKRTGLESYSRKTLQTLVKEQEQEEGEDGVVEKFVFQNKPYSIVKVFLKKQKRIVEFLIYTPSTFQTFKKKYSMSEIQLSIPFINLYFKSGLFRPLAKNILKLLHKELSFHLRNFSKEKNTSNI